MPSFRDLFRKPEAPTRPEAQRAEPALGRRLLDRVMQILGKPVEAARELVAGFRKAGESDKTVTGRLATEAAHQIEKRPALAQAVDKILSGGERAPARQDIAAAEEKLRDRYQKLMRGAAERLVAGKIEPGEFRRQMGRYIRQLQPAAALIGSGGMGPLTENQQKLIERSIREQIGYLDGFIRDVKQRQASGKTLGGREVVRAGMYAGAARATAEQALRQRMADEAEDPTSPDRCEVRVLGAAEHCADCVAMANKPGPVGSLPPIGDSQCGHNCQCHFEFGACEELAERFGGNANAA